MESVSVNLSNYLNQYGVFPRGKSVFLYKIGGEDFYFTGSFGKAARNAIETASRLGVDQIELMP